MKQENVYIEEKLEPISLLPRGRLRGNQCARHADKACQLITKQKREQRESQIAKGSLLPLFI